LAAGLALAGAFCYLALLNTGGYRFGIADQAFYLPVVFDELQHELFPRDGSLLAGQDRWTIFDESVAAAVQATGMSVPTLFLLAHLAGLLTLAWSAFAFAGGLYRSRWTAAAFVCALALRHRITKTGANTLEGYLHPRMLAFAIGVAALAAFMRGRSAASLALVAASAVVHPTTALWFGIWLGAAIIVSDTRWRASVVGLWCASAVAGTWAVTAGPLRGRLVTMDEVWIAALASKDYIFPTEWTADTWAVNTSYVAVILLGLWRRRSLGLAGRRETGLAAGCLTLAALFLFSLPLIWLRTALAVQLQISRVFWMLDFLAVGYLVWLLAEAPWKAGGATFSVRRARAVMAAVAAAALLRGGYVTYVEHAGRRLIERDLAEDDWTDVMSWVRTTPVETHVLADPGHAWRYGTSVRVAGRRDVYLEDVKDAAMALYSREVAVRVVERSAALADFGSTTTERVRRLADADELDLLVSERSFDLPLAYQNRRFRVYRLR
jgi:hypothetical protein